jgi:hypothetical protein
MGRVIEMFLVNGRSDDVAYRVQVDATADEPVIGSTRIQDMLASGEGETVAVTVTGPFLTLDLSDEASVLGALMAWTTVTDVTGNPPEVIPPDVAGAVY